MRIANIFIKRSDGFTSLGATNIKTVLINKIKELAEDGTIEQIQIGFEKPKSEE